MQFTALLLAASAAALSVAAPSDMGSWDVIYDKSFAANGYHAETVAANFTSSSYPGMQGIISRCSTVHIPQTDNSAAVDTNECDEGFSYTFDGSTIKVQQNIELPNKQTVFGEAPLETKLTGAGRTATGRAIVNVTSAIA